jgi:hypothetical protein
MLEPAARSLTMLDTSTSHGRTSAAMRAPMCTAMPSTAADELHLAGVDAGADVEPEVGDRRDGAMGAADRPRRALERSEEAVAGAAARGT